MRYQVDHQFGLPVDLAEWWVVETSWNLRGRRYFSTRQEAETDARTRLATHLAHPTAGPTVNGKKPHGELQIEWTDSPDRLPTNVTLRGIMYVMLGAAPWYFGGRSVKVTRELVHPGTVEDRRWYRVSRHIAE